MENKTATQNVDGFYKVEFGTPRGHGFGVATMKDGQLSGGDSSMYYKGTYSAEGNSFTAKIEIGTHSVVPGVTSVLGASQATLAVSGTIEGTRMNGTGHSPQAPGVTLKFILSRLPD